MASKIPIHATYNGSDSDGLSEYQSGEIVQIDNGLLLGKAHKFSVDAENSWGWGDITADIISKGGANAPTFAAVTGLGNLYAYKFPGSASTLTEVFICWHIPHDYADGTDVYFHTHWINATATPSTNNVVWQFEYSIAKGHGQQAFPSPTTISVTQACSATRYMHHIAETAAVTSANLEVDSLIYCRIFRDAAHASDTNTDSDVYLLTADVHYQKNKFATKNRAPAFNT